MKRRIRRFGIVTAVLGVAASASAAVALAGPVTTLAPDLNGNEATFHAVVDGSCGSPTFGYFLVTDMQTGRTYDTFLDWGHPDQFVPLGGGSYSEGPFGLADNRDWAVRAHSCGTDGNTVFFHVGGGPGSPADVAVSATVSANPAVGQLMNLTITATNGSDRTGTDAFVKNILPAGFQYVACAATIDGLPGGFCWWDGDRMVVDDIGNFKAGSKVIFSIGVRPTAAGSFVDSVGVGAQQYDPDSSNNFLDVPITVAAG